MSSRLDHSTSPSLHIFRDVVLYLVASAVPMIVATIKLPICTRYFSPSEYGFYALATIGSQLIGSIFLSWIANVQWRYYLHYDDDGLLPVLYKRIVILLAFSGVASFLVAWAFSFSTSNWYLRELLYLSVLQVFVAQCLSVFFIAIRIEGKTLAYTIINTIRVAISFGLLLVMMFVLYFRIEALLWSIIIVDVALLLGLVVYRYQKETVPSHTRAVGKGWGHLISFGGYATAINVCILLLNGADRYLISWFYTTKETGIYNQVYTISQISVAALAGAFFSAINPILIRNLQDSGGAFSKTIGRFMALYCVMLVPLTIFLSLFQYQLCSILLGVNFRDGYTLVWPIVSSSFLYGLVMFYETIYKFRDKTRQLAISCIVATAVNIALNCILLPLYGYRAAAYTTLISFGLLLVLVVFDHDKTSLARISPRLVLDLLIIIGVCVGVHLLILYVGVGESLYLSVAEGLTYYIASILFVSLRHKHLFDPK